MIKRAGWKRSLAAFEEKLEDSERRIQEFLHDKHILDDLEASVHEAEARSETSEEHVSFLKDEMSKQSIQFVKKDGSLSA